VRLSQFVEFVGTFYPPAMSSVTQGKLRLFRHPDSVTVRSPLRDVILLSRKRRVG
jgi:hypothetical protein